MAVRDATESSQASCQTSYAVRPSPMFFRLSSAALVSSLRRPGVARSVLGSSSSFAADIAGSLRERVDLLAERRVLDRRDPRSSAMRVRA